MEKDMAETKPDAPVVQPEAAAEEKAPLPKEGKPNSITTSVWAAAGGVAKDAVISAAIQSVRDAIPVVYDLKAEIVGAKKSQQDGQAGTAFEVEVSYTPREVAGKQDPVDVDLVLKRLEVPKAVHDGDPEFLERAPESNPFA